MYNKNMTCFRTLSFSARMYRQTHANLDGFLDEMRHLWNAALEERIGAFRKAGKSITWMDQFKSLTVIRREIDGYDRFPVAAQRSVLQRLDRAFQAFFRRVKAGDKPGFPRFRSRRRAIRSFEIPNAPVRREGRWNTVCIKGIGRLRFKGTIDGVPKLVRIVKTPRRVKVQVLVERDLAPAADDREPLGIDVGISARVALSNGEIVPGHPLDRSALKRRQRRLSRAKRGSASRVKKRLALAREWQRVAEREHGRLHELTADLVRRHGSRFCVEDLRIPNMVKNGRLARSILEQTWGAFVQLLSYKAEEAGGWVKKVPPHNTSQRCSACGAMPDEKLTLAVRAYRCARCGAVEDRDVNAARNILRAGLAPAPPGGKSPVCRETEDERGGSRKARHPVTAQNDIELPPLAA